MLQLGVCAIALLLSIYHALKSAEVADLETNIIPAKKAKLRQTSIRLTPELKKRVAHALVERDTTLQSAIDKGLELWLASDSSAAQKHNLQGILGDFDMKSFFLDFRDKQDKILQLLQAGHERNAQSGANSSGGRDLARGMAELRDAEAEAQELEEQYLPSGARVRAEKTEHPAPRKRRSGNK